LESAFDPDVDDSASATRYLATPKFSHHDFMLPEGAIDDRLTLSLERFRAQETLSPDQRKSLRTNRRLMYTLLNQRAPAKSGRDIA